MTTAQPKDAPPDKEVVTELLYERYGIDRIYRLEVDFPEPAEAPRVLITLERPKTSTRHRERFEIDVKRLDGEGGWEETLDAADALLGSLIEADYAHRELPIGDGLDFRGGTFGVRVRCHRPDLDAEADRLLKEADG